MAKKFLALILVFLFVLPASALGEKASSFPSAFKVTYKTDEKIINGKKSFVSKDYVTTAQKSVDDEINGLVDAFEAERAGKMKQDASMNPRRNSRLDIHVVHSVSGESCVSFLVLARESYKRKQQQSPFVTRVYDMADGRPVTLTDIFREDSAVWDELGDAVYHNLAYHYFPQEQLTGDAERTLVQLASKEALMETPFLLEPVCLTLLYEARTLYPDHPTLMRVSIPYGELREYMTDYGLKQTDNSAYKMVALTFDDGPAYTSTATLLNYLRRAGAQATFFLVGDRIAEYADIVMRENDENHSLQSHHFKHTDTSKSTTARIQAYTEKFYKVLTETVGTEPIMLRAPYGIFDPFIKAKVNLPLIEWDVDTKDWTGKSANGVLGIVKKEVKDGSIILMHDIKEKTPDSAKAVMEWLNNNGYLCVRVEDLFAQYGQDMIPNKIFYSVKTTGDEK